MRYVLHLIRQIHIRAMAQQDLHSCSVSLGSCYAQRTTPNLEKKTNSVETLSRWCNTAMFQVVETENYVQKGQTAGLMLFRIITGSILQPNVDCAWEIKVQTQFSVFTGSKQMPSHLQNRIVIKYTHKLS